MAETSVREERVPGAEYESHNANTSERRKNGRGGPFRGVLGPPP